MTGPIGATVTTCSELVAARVADAQQEVPLLCPLGPTPVCDQCRLFLSGRRAPAPPQLWILSLWLKQGNTVCLKGVERPKVQ